MSFVSIAPLNEIQIIGLELFNNSNSWKGVAMLTEMVASFVMSQAARFANWIEVLIENWTSQSEPIQRASSSDDLSVDDFEVFEASGEDPNDSKVQNAVKNIDSSHQITSETTSTYMELLAERDYTRASFIQELTFTQAKQSNFVECRILPEVKLATMHKREFVLIPVVYQSTVEPHIVLFTINLRDKQIEYYDPKGKKIGDQNIIALGKSVKAFSEKLKSRLNLKVVESKAKHQDWHDGTSCGRFVMHFMRRQLESDSFEDAIQSVKGLPEIKKDLAKDLGSSVEVLAQDAR